MRIFQWYKNKTSGSKSDLPSEWNIPESEEDINQVFKVDSGLQFIYKHSYRCAVCTFSKSRVEQNITENSRKAIFHFVDVIQNRAVSDYIAKLSGIRHQSPQLLVIEGGKVLHHASHGDITADLIEDALPAN